MSTGWKLGLKSFNPKTPSLRHKVWFKGDFRLGRIKKLSTSIKKSTGRNNQGKITVRSKKNYYTKYKSFFLSDFYCSFFGKSFCSVLGNGIDTASYKPFFYVKNQNGIIFNFSEDVFSRKLKYMTGRDIFIEKGKTFFKLGRDFSLGEKGSFAKNLFGSRFVYGAGTFFTVLSKDSQKITVKLPSGKLKNFPAEYFFKIGEVLFSKKNQTSFGSAGFHFKIKNKKSSVRGVAKNPVDHPHGGGEGKKSGKRKSPQGWYNGLLLKSFKS